MKKIFILLFLSISLLGYAQKFQLTDSRENPYTNGDVIAVTITEEDLFFGEYVVHIIVKNLTDIELPMKTLRTNVALVNGTNAYVCTFGNCFSSDLLAIDGTIMGEYESYDLHVLPDASYSYFGLSKFKLEFWSEKDESDKMTLFVEIDMQPLGIKGQNPVSVSLSASPNPAPAHSTINVSYTLTDKNDNNRLVIRNIMGAMVMNIPLDPYENSIFIDAQHLKAGAYFYAIENKNHISIAKKLIVK